MPRFLIVCLWIGLAWGLTGCSDEPLPDEDGGTGGPAGSTAVEKSGGSPATSGSADGVAKVGAGQTPAGSPRPAARAGVPARTTLNGNWMLRVLQVAQSQQQQQQNPVPVFGERTIMLISLDAGMASAGEESAAEGAELKASFIAGRSGLEELVISSATRDAQDVNLEFEFPDHRKLLSFQGRFLEGYVLGTVVSEDGTIGTARLVPTNEKTLIRVPEFDPLPEQGELFKLAESPVPDEDARLFSKAYPASPLVRMAWRNLIQEKVAKEAKPAEFEPLLDECLKLESIWGPRYERVAEFEMVSSLVAMGVNADWALARLESLGKKLEADPGLAGMTKQLAIFRERALMQQTIDLVHSPDETKREEGRTRLRQLLKENPFNPALVLQLADDAREQGRVDEALQLYAELAVLPMQERLLQSAWQNDPVQHVLPTERVSTLWKEKHGGTDGLDEFLNQVYEERLLAFADAPVTERSGEGNHVVLCELFTGARCAPCVSADVAIDGIEQTYPSSMVVALRYHVHIPGQDPLANNDSEARHYNYYRSPGTPFLYVDGGAVPGVAGALPNATAVYQGLRKITDTRLEDKTDVKISLSAVPQDDTVQVHVTVEGFDASADRLRLRIALAESSIQFAAFNGIRHHEMVVRKLIGGDRGVAPTDGKLEFHGSVNLKDLRDELHHYLTEFERNQGIEFVVMPLDLKNLHVVAFVQDDSTHAVLQTVIAPVEAAGNQ